MLRSRAIAISLAAVAVTAGSCTAAGAAPGIRLAAHRAVYDLQLEKATDRSGIDGMYGRMVYEFSGSACDGYTTRFRIVTEVRSGSGDRMTDQRTTTYENPAKHLFRFTTQTFADNSPDSEVSGTALDGSNGLSVALKTPESRHLDLPGSRFPTEHMLEVIRRAEASDMLFQSRLFDGSEDADQSMLTTTVIGKEQKPKPSDSEAKKAGRLADHSYWPVSIAYFDDKAKGDQVPEYRLDFKLYADGVSRDLTMDYGDFVLKGRLAELDFLKQPACGF